MKNDGLKKTKIIAWTAMLVALSIVLGKFLQIPVGDSIRISFENLPILIAGFAFGPYIGVLTGVVADLLGCFIMGYQIIPLITIAAGIMGLLPGLLRYIIKKRSFISIYLMALITHLISSVLIKSIALHFTYGQPWILLAIRLYYIAIALAEAFIIYSLNKKKVISF